MKKIRGFTLVEMLIVIVIVGLLVVYLAPKLTGTQSKGRDLARQAALKDIGLALTTYEQDEGILPEAEGSIDTLPESIDERLKFNTPTDPQKSRIIQNCSNAGTAGQFYYVPLRKSGLQNGAYALIASVEEKGAANRVRTGDESTCIPAGTDYASIAKQLKTCRGEVGSDACPYNEATDTLRHVYMN